MSSRLLSEIYIIDHSTTTAQAASHTGGVYGKGGDFLYRWGNPEAYDMGDSNDRTLFSQHYPHWIPQGLIDENKILIFNNGNEIRHSAVDIISPPTTSPGAYFYDDINGFGPVTSEWSYKAPNPEDFFSSILSSAQRLPNGNTLICDGDSGYFFELDPDKNIVWEYINPDTANGILSQGDTPSSNFVFRALKFSPDYPAFIGRDLTPGYPIELNPNLSNCTILGLKSNIISDTRIYPNPTSDIINIESVIPIEKTEVYDLYGKLVATNHNSTSINIYNLAAGVYLFKIKTNEGYALKKVIKK
jgi:hypothetical protein